MTDSVSSSQTNKKGKENIKNSVGIRVSKRKKTSNHNIENFFKLYLDAPRKKGRKVTFKPTSIHLVEKKKNTFNKQHTFDSSRFRFQKTEEPNALLKNEQITRREKGELPKILPSQPSLFSPANALELSFGENGNFHPSLNLPSGDKNFLRMKTYGHGEPSNIIATTEDNTNTNVVIQNENENENDAALEIKNKEILTEKKFLKTYGKIKTFSHNSNRRNHSKRSGLNSSGLIENQTTDQLRYPKYPAVKYSSKPVGDYIKAYAVNSYVGVPKTVNEDKVSIILTITKPKEYKGDHWPQCSFIAVYDGHNGGKCSTFLRDNLHHFVVKNNYFPNEPEKALKFGFQKAEEIFINNAIKTREKSGSSALVVLILDDMMYIASSGDSKVMVSMEEGKINRIINSEHTPNNRSETRRITENGGNVFSSLIDTSNGAVKRKTFRVSPGFLVTTRSIGDIDSKLPSLGGKQNVIIATPEITKLRITSKLDFVILGTNSIFDKINSGECSAIAWKMANKNKRYGTVHILCGRVVDRIMKSVLKRGCLDNITTIFIGFESYEKKYKDTHYILRENDEPVMLSYRGNAK